MESLAAAFIRESISRIEMNTPKINKCVQTITDEQIWQRPNAASNSIGNMLLHLCGNIGQYILSSLGNNPDNRDRDREFETGGGFSKAELMEKLIRTVSEAVDIIDATGEEGLMQVHRVQGFDLSGMGIIIHVTEHYSYHTGQIIFWTKLLTNKDLEFYKGIDLNQKNIL